MIKRRPRLEIMMTLEVSNSLDVFMILDVEEEERAADRYPDTRGGLFCSENRVLPRESSFFQRVAANSSSLSIMDKGDKKIKPHYERRNKKETNYLIRCYIISCEKRKKIEERRPNLQGTCFVGLGFIVEGYVVNWTRAFGTNFSLQTKA